MSFAIDDFRKTLTWNDTVSRAEIEETVATLRMLDTEAESKSKKQLGLGCSGLVLGVLIGATALGASYPILAVIGALVLIGGVWLLISSRKWKRQDVENRRYELIDTLSRLLSTDMASDATFELQSDFGKAQSTSHCVKQGKVGVWKVKYFAQPWLRLCGRLLDGTQFTIQSVDKVQQRHKSYRSRSGKHKTKTKYKHGAEFILHLRFKPHRYPNVAALDSRALDAVQLPGAVELKKLRVSDNNISTRVALRGVWGEGPKQKSDFRSIDGSSIVIGMLLSSYQILNMSKAIEFRKSRGAGQ